MTDQVYDLLISWAMLFIWQDNYPHLPPPAPPRHKPPPQNYLSEGGDAEKLKGKYITTKRNVKDQHAKAAKFWRLMVLVFQMFRSIYFSHSWPNASSEFFLGYFIFYQLLLRAIYLKSGLILEDKVMIAA